MSDKLDGIFSDEQMQRLILAYLYSRKDEQVPNVDTHAFLVACKCAVVEGESVMLVADGLALVQWDKDSGLFAFGISDAGIRQVEDSVQA